MTTTEAAKVLGVTSWRVIMLIRSGKLTALETKSPNGATRYKLCPVKVKERAMIRLRRF